MERFISVCLWLILVLNLVFRVAGNAEVDALKALKTNLTDPKNVLQTWNTTQPNPCRWFHVTCNSENSVTRVDLQNANLSGQLVPQLGQLINLQFLELSSNNISGIIPEELGNLLNLVSLDLYSNALTGHIPTILGKLSKLRFLRLNNNTFTGQIPMSLTAVMSLQVLNLSNNQLEGDIPVNGSFSLFNSSSFANNRLNPRPPISPTAPTPSGNSATVAIAGGFAASTVLLFAAPAIVFVWVTSFSDFSKGNYVEEEVEQKIQVALLCTQGAPMERPKMTEVVRMLEGDGLAERWGEWQNEEMFRQEFNQPCPPPDCE